MGISIGCLLVIFTSIFMRIFLQEFSPHNSRKRAIHVKRLLLEIIRSKLYASGIVTLIQLKHQEKY